MAASDASADRDDLALMLEAARTAGEIALGYFGNDARTWMKAGNSPVSEADIATDDSLRKALLGARPDYGWLSEEATEAHARPGRDAMFVVDPIDGTRGFLAGDAQWCLCLAVVRDMRPRAAVIHCPALGRTYAATTGGGATCDGRPIINAPSSEVGVVTGSRRINREIAEKLGDTVAVRDFVPSLAYRLALVAGGEIDGAFAHSGAHDWDIAAADLILSEAGGTLTALDGQTMRYSATTKRAPALIAAGPGREAAMFALAKKGGFLQ